MCFSMCFSIFSVHGKIVWNGPKRGRGGFFPANPDRADIFGDMDLDSEKFNFRYLLDSKFVDFQVPRFPKSGLGRAWASAAGWALGGQVGSGTDLGPRELWHSLAQNNLPRPGTENLGTEK